MYAGPQVFQEVPASRFPTGAVSLRDEPATSRLAGTPTLRPQRPCHTQALTWTPAVCNASSSIFDKASLRKRPGQCLYLVCTCGYKQPREVRKEPLAHPAHLTPDAHQHPHAFYLIRHQDRPVCAVKPEPEAKASEQAESTTIPGSGLRLEVKC